MTTEATLKFAKTLREKLKGEDYSFRHFPASFRNALDATIAELDQPAHTVDATPMPVVGLCQCSKCRVIGASTTDVKRSPSTAISESKTRVNSADIAFSPLKTPSSDSASAPPPIAPNMTSPEALKAIGWALPSIPGDNDGVMADPSTLAAPELSHEQKLHILATAPMVGDQWLCDKAARRIISLEPFKIAGLGDRWTGMEDYLRVSPSEDADLLAKFPLDAKGAV